MCGAGFEKQTVWIFSALTGGSASCSSTCEAYTHLAGPISVVGGLGGFQCNDQLLRLSGSITVSKMAEHFDEA